ncbi:ABC transporter permease subunit [Paenibacillus sp. FSL H8-0457]|uniref:ABC transporter permease n=1 Tax=Bacillales TaxID=1385 RepID=UPI00017890F1|nr:MULTISPECIES: ABC transporter permease subunit [Paenibacillus]ACX68163.1 binding-protein-dependent transport systems inner membrane component [Paenibacillus sp. Y412MC10]ETT65059.1 binding-protein-dependent transport systems inner membrane component [Paenibacillus sp. FSL H8-457]MCM3261443.1 ABC transporter permease subunit [Paenibacillus lautus]
MSPTAPKPQPEGLSSKGKVYSRSFLRRLMKQWDAQLMVIPGIILVLIFSYLPMYGVLTGFMDYNLFTGSRIWENPWVGFKHFEAFFAAPEFERLIRNTIVISLLKFLIGFPAPIILALMLNEVRHMFFKRVVQTITYLPHFMSWVIVAGLTTALLATENGSVNMLLQKIGTIQEPINFLSLKEYFLSILISANVWKEIGFGSIVYLAAIASVDPHLYEAADMDGASKFKQIYLITLPSILPVVVIFMILAIGNLLNAGFEDILLLATNPVLRPVSDVIDTYVYRVGIGSHRYSYGVAIGLFKAIISIGLLTIANYIARRSGNSLW